MSLIILDASARTPIERSPIAVCVPVYGAHDRFVECLASLLAHTALDVPLLIADDASPDGRSLGILEQLEADGVLRHTVYYARSTQNQGFVTTVNDAFARTAPADVVVVNSDCVVTPGWIDAMSGAARNTLVATVSVFTNNGTILSVPYRNRPQSALPQTISLVDASLAVMSGSLRLRPRIPTVVGHCFLVKRAALDLVGPFDVAFSPGYGEEVDFAQRCLRTGLLHVVADDVLVFHAGSASFAPGGVPNPIKAEHDAMIGVRYPYYYEWIREFAADDRGPFARALQVAARSLRGLTITIDARVLTPIVTGTQIHVLEVIAAISRQGFTDLRVVVPRDLGEYARVRLRSLANVRTIVADDATGHLERSDVVHRPYQVFSNDDLALLGRLGERIVITQQDLISYHNPGYFPSYRAWVDHRALTRRAMAIADQVVFFSHCSAEEAINEALVPRERAEVVYIGTDHAGDPPAEALQPPRAVRQLGGRPFLLCLGTDFAHKNRPFALRVLDALRTGHLWDGGLVFAGPHVDSGSSAAAEAEFLALHPRLAQVVIDVAAVDESAKRWLLANAAAMIYPSVHEGFGLVPFEAADAGLLCAFAPQTAIGELLPSWLALIEPWNAGATAARLRPLLESAPLRAEHLAAVRAAAAPLTWRQTGRSLGAVYAAAAASEMREARKLVVEAAAAGEEVTSLRGALDAARGELGAVRAERDAARREITDWVAHQRLTFDKGAEGLVGPDGVLPAEVRRLLLGIGYRPALRMPVFGMLKLAYRCAHRLRSGGTRALR